MRALADLFPDSIPAPLALEPHQHWMLLADVGESLRGNFDLSQWEAALVMFGQNQREAIRCVNELLAEGCLDRRLDRLAAQIDLLLTDATALSCLDSGEADRLRGLGPRLKAMCSNLASYGIPETLVHADFHPGNVATSSRDTRPRGRGSLDLSSPSG